MPHYYSSNNVRLLTYTFLQVKKTHIHNDRSVTNQIEYTGLRQDSYLEFISMLSYSKGPALSYGLRVLPSATVVKLKLVRTPLNVYFTAFKSIFLSLFAPITSDECHAWFHLNAASPAARNAEQVNITKILDHGRIRTTKIAPLVFQRVPLTTRLLGQLTVCD